MPTAWSKFDGKTYQAVIKNLRLINVGSPFWTIESRWQGFR